MHRKVLATFAFLLAALSVLGLRGRMPDASDLVSLTREIGGTMAFAINADGEVAGSSQTANVHTHAVVWEDGVPVDLGALPNLNDFSIAYAIAYKGDVAGYYLEQNGQPMAVLWRGGKLIPLGTSPGYFVSKAYGINELGQVVGEATQSDTFRVHAVVWTAGEAR